MEAMTQSIQKAFAPEATEGGLQVSPVRRGQAQVRAKILEDSWLTKWEMSKLTMALGDDSKAADSYMTHVEMDDEKLRRAWVCLKIGKEPPIDLFDNDE
jgi:hypothetical protein